MIERVNYSNTFIKNLSINCLLTIIEQDSTRIWVEKEDK
jgi:hypothetical protein